MSPLEAPEMPIPFGVSAETGRPIDGIDEASLNCFKNDGHERAVAREYLEAKAESGELTFGTIGDVDAGRLDQAGWAVIFAPSAGQRIREALQPLLDHRRAQAGDAKLFKVFEAPQPEDTATAWLHRNGVRMDVVDPELGVPYYILIVGPPEEISFEFQYGLDLYWAVGRLWFETADEFRQYADSLVRYETMPVIPTSRQMAVFAPRHEFDAATQLFSSQVADHVVNAAVGQRQNFGLRAFIGDPATRGALDSILRGDIDGGPPAVLFTGTHGEAPTLPSVARWGPPA